MNLNKLALWKTYFDNGFGLMSYPKLVIAVVGVGEIVNKNYLLVGIGSILFFIACFFLGWIIIKSGFLEAINEIQNRNNLFVKEMRSYSVKRNNRKLYK